MRLGRGELVDQLLVGDVRRQVDVQLRAVSHGLRPCLRGVALKQGRDLPAALRSLCEFVRVRLLESGCRVVRGGVPVGVDVCDEARAVGIGLAGVSGERAHQPHAAGKRGDREEGYGL